MVLQQECIALIGMEVNAFRLGLQEAEAHAEAGHMRRTHALQVAAAQHVQVVRTKRSSKFTLCGRRTMHMAVTCNRILCWRRKP